MGNPDSDFVDEKKDDENNRDKNPTPPRDNLIKTAVKFLSDKKIQNQDPTLLKKFLLKKGLTEEEVSIAFEQFNSIRNLNLVSEYERPAQLSGHFAVPPPLPPPVPSTMWHTVHSIVTTITSIGGIIYAVYWLWKTYIAPYLFGRKPKKKSVETSLAELEAAVAGCTSDMRTIRSSLEVLAEHRAADFTQSAVVTKIQEVKSEVNSLKALLLSRNQFPAVPTPMGNGSISIPAWQLEAENANPAEHEGEGEVEEEGSGSNATTNGSDSSLEIVKDPNN